MKFFKRTSALLLLSVLLGGAAQAATLEVMDGVELHGFVSTSYNYNFNNPDPATNANRIYDFDHNSFKFDVGELVLLKEANDPGTIGFRTDITYGNSVPVTIEGDPDADFSIQQAYVTYHAPVGSGLKIDAGRFVTHLGAELIEGYDGWNYNFSRSYLAGLAVAFTHVGVRASYTLNDKVSLLGMVANGWDNTTDNNEGKTLGLQVAYQPSDNVSLLLNWAGGPERDNSHDWRNIFDVVLDMSLTNRTSMQFNFDYGTEENGAGPGNDATWWGLAGILRHDYNDWFSMNLRGEFFSDDDGTKANQRTTAPFNEPIVLGGQDLWEITVTPEFRINQNMVVRLEYRHDDSDANAFIDDNGAVTDSQDTVAVNALFYF